MARAVPFQTGDFGFLLFTQIEGRWCADDTDTLSNIGGATLFSGYPVRVSLFRGHFAGVKRLA
jgi:hypothetical protein